MSITQKKNDLVTKLGLFTTINNSTLDLNKFKNQYDTAINFANDVNKDPVMFCVNILSTLLGKDVLKAQLKVILNDVIPDLNPILKSNISNLINTNNSNSALPTKFTTSGYDIPIKKLDINNQLKSSTPEVGSLNDVILKTIKVPGSIISFQGLNLSFNPLTQNINLSASNTLNISSFLKNIIDNTSFVNKDLIISESLDYIFGTLLKNKNLSKKDINNDLILNKIIENGVNDDTNETYFTLTASQLSDIENKTDNLQNQSTLIDLDCGNLNFMLDLETFNEILNSDDPLDALDNKLNNVVSDLPVQANDDIKPSALRDISKTNNNNMNYNNNSAVKDDVFKNMFKAITTIIIKNTISSPQILLIQTLVDNFNNINFNNNIISDIQKYIESKQKFIRCLIELIKEKLSEKLFELVKNEVIKLAQPVLAKIIQEALESYTKTITSLSPIKPN